ncbi:low-specificity L-threonine aldolase [Aggregatilinea lenta]|uniref:low-specificity L-threonine aldolase n=1 Tax=Aggregatilinea lenta TaxID=913108 RepID=UPI000E5C2F8B|nr:low-specificity L-threonine aldolase [Aggregatilinea lenta]
MDRIDLRSDTVTWPTVEMRKAMAEAAVGDDVYGEDPTVNQLEADAARRLGKEAALFVSSGTMGNLAAILAHCGRGDEAIIGDKSHTFEHEVGGMAALGGVQPSLIPVQADGTLPLEAIRHAIRSEDVHYPTTRLIALENTQGSVGGIPIPKPYIDVVGALAHENGLLLHIDGARLFNAATALDCDVAELVAAADSVTFCLSKGLCAPVGSVLVGSHEFIHRARRVRKMLGGGTRQAGMLAAAGLIALHEMTGRLGDDHANARLLAEGLSELPQIDIDLDRVQTNMVFFSLRDDAEISAPELAERLKAHNIWIMAMDERQFRAVTHYWIRPEHVIEVLVALQEELS